jgi:hypothetical protein
VTLVRTDVSEELSATVIRVARIGELGTTLAETSHDALCEEIPSEKGSWCGIQNLGCRRVTNQNLIQDEIKRRLNSGNACYHSVQNLLSSRLLSKNVKVRIYSK